MVRLFHVRGCSRGGLWGMWVVLWGWCCGMWQVGGGCVKGVGVEGCCGVGVVGEKRPSTGKYASG